MSVGVRRLLAAGGLVAPVLAGAGCDGFAAEGEIVVSLARDGGDEAGAQAAEPVFVDGWTVNFSKVLVSLGDLTVAQVGGETAARSQAIYVADLVSGDPEIEVLESLAAQRWDDVSFSMRPPTGEARIKAFGASDADVSRLRDGGYNYWIEGAATIDARTVTFAWGVADPTRHEECTSGADKALGLAVVKNRAAALAITVHLEHLFHDTLGAEQGRLRFDAIAAVADNEGVVSWAALAEQDLDALVDDNGDPLTDGDGPVVYDARETTLPRSDLQRFILASLRAAVHIGGEGRCVTSPL